MSAFTKFNRVSNFPTYKVTYAKALDYCGKGAFSVTFIGVNNKSKFGDHRQPYVDILEDNDEHVRVNVSHSYVDDFDELIHDKEAMQEIEAGKVSIEFEKRTSPNGDYALITWIEG